MLSVRMTGSINWKKARVKGARRKHVFQPPRDVLELLPDSYIELVFSFGSSAQVEWEESTRPLPRCYLVGLLNKPCRVRARGMLKSVAARFYAWGFYPLLGRDVEGSPNTVQVLNAEWQGLADQLGPAVQSDDAEAAVKVLHSFTQGVLVQRLLPRLGEAKVALGSLLSEVTGYGVMALAASISSAPWLVIGFVLFGFGESSLGPSVGGLISRMAGPSEQGRVQGSRQPVQALARMAGPILGGQLYVSIGRASPYVSSAALVILAIAAVWRAHSKVRGAS